MKLSSKSVEEKHFACSLCNAECGLVAEVSNNTVISIKSDRKHPLSRGYCCPKGLALAKVTNDPDRVHTPLKRVGSVFQPISWKQAIREIAAQLKDILAKDSPHSIAYYYGTNAAHHFEHATYVKGFMASLGSQSVYSADSVDSNNKFVAQNLLYGNSAIMPLPDLPRTRFLLLVGTNPGVSNLSLVTCANVMKVMRGILDRGGEIYVIDPRRTETAKILTKSTPDHYIPIWPNTDVFLLLAMINHIFRAGLEDEAFLAQHALQVGELRELVRDFTPEQVSPICKIPATQICSLAEKFAKTDGAAIYGRLGTSLSTFNTLNAWAIEVLHVIAGKLDRPGGVVFGKNLISIPKLGRLVGTGEFGTKHSRVGHFPVVMGDLPVGTLAREILAPVHPIRALFVSGGNPILAAPNSGELGQALSRLELCVVLDFYVNETALAAAHYILPVTTPLERDYLPLFLLNYQVFPHIEYHEAVVQSKHTGPKEEWEILSTLSRLLHRPFFGILPLEIINRCLFLVNRQGVTPNLFLRGFLLLGQLLERKIPGLSSGTLTFQQLKRRGYVPQGRQDYGVIKKVLQTPGKKIKLISPVIREQLLKCTEHLFTEYQINQMAKPSHFLLVEGRSINTLNSWMHNATTPREPSLWMNPLDGEALNISEGDIVIVKTSRGEINVPTHLTSDIIEGVVYYPHGWGHHNPFLSRAAFFHGENVNLLTDSIALDPLSGIPQLTGMQVIIEKQ